MAINNIDHVKWSIRQCIHNLKLSKLLESLAYFKSDIEADRCRITLELIIDNAVDILNNKIAKLLEVFGDKVCLVFCKKYIRHYEVCYV